MASQMSLDPCGYFHVITLPSLTHLVHQRPRDCVAREGSERAV